ncbi:glutathione S-transferase family protein [Aquabacter spiritensis]|uniref:Glutathione S-transferase n=1 Tax=Aquabacter spiritensis TaxID=933073 RepID=A0A4R3M0T2_9HYPH|nr:glutathione S-transferase family protein [Aquabacter spiritensis]TCT06691.1 glutathione S-transferase [Aquabacter spiritensis]
MTAPATLYELAGADPDLRFSPHCWKARMALAHKGVAVAGVPWRFTEKEAIAFSGQGLVPVLVADGETVSDSFRIAEYLETRYPDRPSLFGGETGRAIARFVNSWADTALVPAVAKLVVLDIYERLDPKDRDYFRATREKRFGMPLEQVVGDPAVRLSELRQALTPLRHMLQHQPFICGAAPAYADYCVFGMLMWARCVSPVETLAADDPVHGWRERLLDAYDGLARGARHCAPCGN